jgi:hypothetical protein
MALMSSRPPSSDDGYGGGKIYYEFARVGAYVKVSALHVETGTEVSIVGAASAAQADLQRLARLKLLRKLAGR